MSTATAYRPEIDGLRTVAVMTVLFFHVGFAWVPGGFIGVDVFFVISGYLITRLICAEVERTGGLNLGNFYLRRIRRIGPALLVTVAGSMIAAYFILPPEPTATFGGSVVSALLSFSNFYFWTLGGYFDTDKLLKPLLHTWSLSVEEQFYAFWPLLLAFSLRRLPKGSAPFILLSIGLISLAWSVADINDREAIYYLPQYRSFELAIGAGVVWLERYKPRTEIWMEIAFIMGLALIGVSALAYSESTLFPSYAALPPTIGAGLVIYAGRTRYASRLLANKPMEWVGLTSYSLYLVHWPIIVFYTYVYGQDLTTAQKWSLIAVSLAGAGIMYFMVERLTKREKATSLLKGWRFGYAAAALAVLIMAPGTHAWATQGWIWRQSVSLQALINKQNYEVELPKYPLRCFMIPTVSPDDIDPGCYTIGKPNGKPNILLLGDSTVEHLMSGLYGRLNQKANFYLWSGSDCPPIPGASPSRNPNCNLMNERFFKTVLPANNYDLVIISVSQNWQYMIDKFPLTAKILSAKHTSYVLIGQVIEYRDAPINLVAKHGTLAGLDVFMKSQLAVPCEGEHGLEKVVPPNHFFSLKAVLCSKGFPIFRDQKGLLQHDNTHLSQRGSVYVGDRLIPWLVRNEYIAEPGDFADAEFPDLDRRIGDLEKVRTALEQYHSDNGKYPVSTGFDGFQSKYGADGATWINGLVPKYLDALPLDPLAKTRRPPQYIYRSDGKDFKLLAHQTNDCLMAIRRHPAMADPLRNCWGYGFWTKGAERW